MGDPGAVEQRMRPGVWTAEGFLKRDASLEEVLAADNGKLGDLGADAYQLGERLRLWLDAARGTDMGYPRRVGVLNIEIHRKRGLITCPWAPDEGLACPAGGTGVPTADRFVIAAPALGIVLAGFVLSAHLIREHSFFGGPGSPFRIEPHDLFHLAQQPGE